MESMLGKVYIVGGLHFGNEGRGLLSTISGRKLTRRHLPGSAGPQAAHHVVTSSGLWHCFSHYGSDMLQDKCVKVLSKLMLVYSKTLVR